METVKPFVKWARGKGSLISQLTNYYPFELKDGTINKYIEQFVGVGAVLIEILKKYNVNARGKISKLVITNYEENNKCIQKDSILNIES